MRSEAARAALSRYAGSEQSASLAPVSSAQARLWILSELHPASPAYNLKTAYRIAGNLDVPALERSLEALAQRHEVLRTTFTLVDGVPMQRISPALAVALPRIELGPGTAAEREAQLQREIAVLGARPFDLRRGPLIRTALFGLAPDEHVLMFVMHHIIFDDGSVPIFNRELTELYRAHRFGVPHALADVPLAYRDFAAWQNDSLRDEETLRYWRAQLAGAPARIELPLDAPRPALQGFRGAVRTSTLPPALAERVRGCGHSHGTTLYMTLLAAFGVLLYRYTGQTDLVVGSPIANRTRTELESLIGFFVNTVALRIRMNGASTFRDILRDVRETAIAAYDNQDVPFEQVVADVAPERSLSGTPLVNVMFSVRADLGAPLELEGLSLTRLPIASTTSKFDLSLRVTDTPAGLVCSLQYDTELFAAAKIDGLLEHFANVVDGLVREPAAPIASIAMLSPAQRKQMIVAWNATASKYAGEHSPADLFEQQAARTPAAPAVTGADGESTYRELNEAANRLAHELRERGVRTGDVVGVCADRSITTIVCTLAVVKAGAAYLPLDPEYPPDRLAYMLRAAGARVAVGPRAALTTLARLDGISAIDADAPELGRRSADNPHRTSTSDDVLYVMYTSGSTGRPKGVPITGRAVCRLVTGTNYVRMNASDVFAQAANASFDAATFELWGALVHGARLAIVPRDVVLSPQHLANFLAAQGVTIMFLTAALFRYVAATVPAAFGTLRCLIVGGEAVDPAAARAVLETAPPARLLNGYGPTEATTFACTYEITLPVDGPIPIGRPISNTESYILDVDLNPLPPGVPGQLYLGGPGLARGYLNDPELSARKFIAHPFSAAAQARLYATGDVARYRADGNIEYLGRVDRQVKIRGFRIEVDEIESVLKTLAGVRDAVVVVRTDAAGDKLLAAYVVDEQRPERDLQTWRALLGRILPDYMLPGAVVVVPALPLTPNGKVDLAALPDPRPGGSHGGRLGAAHHYQLVGLWCDLLGYSMIGPRENFFALGGHSLLATRMIAEVARIFGRQVPLAAFFANPTIEQLATLIATNDDAPPQGPLIGLRSAGTKPAFFFLHGDLRGGGYYPHKLVRAFDPEQPFSVLPPHGFAGTALPATIEAMADDYLAVIRAAQPHGPYVVGGFCMGGLVALEIARALQAANETVCNCILVDAPGLNGLLAALVTAVDGIAALLRIDRLAFRGVLGVLGRIAAFIEKATISISAARKESRLGTWLFRVFRANNPARPAQGEDEASLLEFAYRDIVARYLPGRYRGRLTLLVPADEWAERDWSVAGWKAVAPQLEVMTLPGKHLTCITTFVDETGARINQLLNT